jgi:Hint module
MLLPKMKSAFFVASILGLACTLVSAAPSNGGSEHEYGVSAYQQTNHLRVQMAERLFYPIKSAGVAFYMAALQTYDVCSSRKIEYTDLRESTYIPGSFYIPHTKILASGIRCGSGSQKETMLLLPGNLLTDARTAQIANASDAYAIIRATARISNTFNSLSSVDPIYVGVEVYSDRVCGGKVHWPKGSVFMFVNAENKNIDFRQYGFILNGEDAMLSYKGNTSSPSACVYKNSVIPGPNMSALPTPSGIPIPAASSSPKAYDGFAVKAPIVLASPNVSVATSSAPTTTATTNSSMTTSLLATSSGVSSSSVLTSSGSRTNATTSTGANSQSSMLYTSSNSAGVSIPQTDPVVVPAGSPGSTPQSNKTDSSCFPGAARIETDDGKYIRMNELKVGDRVRVGSDKFSEVFMFTHKLKHTRNEFVRIEVASGHSMALTAGHYLYVNGNLRAAGSVRVDDVLTLSNGESSSVLRTELVNMEGLFNPQTVDGRIVVDDILASTYTQAVRPAIAHALLAPVRLLHHFGWSPLKDAFHSTTYGLDLLSPKGALVC